ncbi:DUF1799 domain-containing protein [Aquincola tertiaricarbonis]|uniref:DUF1799 domain-containing protein n=1 Tax=Aquincola tertiaricarbonis TaxID=391953 RepID=UPI000698CBB6|nr:DUF1799 domain-containing protein [Aquincola tertiaricarbonis]
MEKTVEVFPDNWQAAVLFLRMGNNWRVGPAGPYGLDFNVLFHKMDRMKLTPERYEELEEEIGVIEDAALQTMHAAAKRAAGKGKP